MLCQIFSDCHMEAYNDPKKIWDIVTPIAPIAIVAGDIHSKRYEEQLTEIASKFKHVIALYGNHEWYGRDKSWRANKKRLPKNVHILDREVWEYYNVVFIGATLWTDFKQMDWFVMDAAKRCINDFHVIRAGDHKFTPQMALDEHVKDKRFIVDMIEHYKDMGKKIVVCTHFMPSYQCVHDKWKKDPRTDSLNHYFSANCDDLLITGKIKTWVCGHTHDSIDKTVGRTKVVCNPVGYPGIESSKYSDYIVEV